MATGLDTRPEYVLERFVEFSQVSKVYPTRNGPTTVVEDFTLKVHKGEFVVIIGHSGCGKSTVLSMAAGLHDVSAGGIILDGREVNTAGPDRGIVFKRRVWCRGSVPMKTWRSGSSAFIHERVSRNAAV